MADLSVGQVIWASLKPIIKIYLIIGTGFFLSKKNILTVETTRNVSDMVLMVLLPSLIFNKIVTNIEGKDIKDVGIIALTSILIFGIGGICSLIVNLIFPVPKRWFGGLLCGGIFPNISDIPIAYIQSMDTGLVFSTAQGEIAVSHIVIYLTMFSLCLFNLGGFRLMEMDFLREKHDRDLEMAVMTNNENKPDELPDSTSDASNDHQDSIQYSQRGPRLSRGLGPGQETQESDLSNDESESDGDSLPDDSNNHPIPITREDSLPKATKMLRNRSTSFSHPHLTVVTSRNSRKPRRYSISSQRSRGSVNSDTSSFVRANRRVTELRRMASQTNDDVINEYSQANDESLGVGPEPVLHKILTTDVGITTEDVKNSGQSIPFIKKYHLGFVIFFLKNCLRPCSLATIIALVIAFIPWVKALFVHTSVYLPDAPDELPALNFIMDYTSYVGAASVPFALLLLGGAMARIQITSLPKGFLRSVVLLIFLRLCIMPILGVLWMRAMVAAGWVDKDDVMLRFVSIISWGLPTMTTMIYFTASYTPPESEDKLQMNCVSIYLLLQYPLLLISLPFLSTYTIKVELGY